MPETRLRRNPSRRTDIRACLMGLLVLTVKPGLEQPQAGVSMSTGPADSIRPVQLWLSGMSKYGK